MSTDSNLPATVAAEAVQEIKQLREHWWAFLALGIVLAVIGSVCIIHPFMASVTSVVLLGFLMVAAGIAQVLSSFLAGKWSGMFLHLFVGVLYGLVGFMIIDSPVENTLLLTKILAIFLMVVGLLNILTSLIQRFHGWGWVLLNGGVTFLLGLLINRQWPSSALWVIGLFIGIEMIFNGWAWIMFAFGIKPRSQAA
ncbi:HdeD family acid-resistance protein [Bythopirellula polymerisocia]|uniref:Acid-resistance membrane protein n=1 Tax=Bythopirellula polymerisocia TaxID=2528003 RepID=A0A5C6CSB7_9BACT|nr:HdeD family acid-resistance protein [Bythopirellula polymerisocia]TWU25709.1 acid-resistance membrane protein [Bythopirellula polymerisocia]